MDGDLRIRNAELSDAAELAALACDLGYKTTGAEMESRLVSILKDPRYKTLVASKDEKICGMIGTFSASRCHERLEARVTREQKEMLQRAAELSGLSLTDFLITSAQNAAEAAIREHSIITLTARDSIAFAEALLTLRKPNAALRAAFDRYDQEVTFKD